ncbi:MAG TPA: hypothetical protein VM779_16230 [Thermoanaerobaculia bacterium]|nr:hypothetical protein [Thermoanaerobaculia bacterium]
MDAQNSRWRRALSRLGVRFDPGEAGPAFLLFLIFFLNSLGAERLPYVYLFIALALEIRGDSLSAIYETERVTLTATRRARYLVASLGNDLPHFTWIGANDTPLPFQNVDEIAAFLRAAKVVRMERKRLPGITKPRKVLLDKNGVRAWAVFRSLHREEENAKWETGEFTEFLRDSYLSDIAAYELSRILDVDSIPPTVLWKMGRRSGSLQIWVENATLGYRDYEVRKPPDPERWQRELQRMKVFDALIGNLDRHPGNMLVDSNERVWWIDHTRALGRERELFQPEQIERCERRLYERLKSADPAVITERLSPYMSQREIDALLERRMKLVALIDDLIAAKGEASVLYTLED